VAELGKNVEYETGAIKGVGAGRAEPVRFAEMGQSRLHKVAPRLGDARGIERGERFGVSGAVVDWSRRGRLRGGWRKTSGGEDDKVGTDKPVRVVVADGVPAVLDAGDLHPCVSGERSDTVAVRIGEGTEIDGTSLDEAYFTRNLAVLQNIQELGRHEPLVSVVDDRKPLAVLIDHRRLPRYGDRRPSGGGGENSGGKRRVFAQPQVIRGSPGCGKLGAHGRDQQGKRKRERR
jgi:hypothetical protein